MTHYLYYPGCFRCHDDQHVSAEGKAVRNDCDICHTILSQNEGGTPMAAVPGASFAHPIDIGDLREASCSSCHTGGA